MGWFDKKKSSESAPVEQIWQVCPKCGAHVLKQEWEALVQVCPQCGHHDRMTCQDRMALLVDEGSFREFAQEVMPRDPLKFADAKGAYVEKARETAGKLGMGESVLTGSGDIGGIRCSLAVMDFRFMGGSLSSGCGEKICRAAEHALKHNRAFVMVSASGGARMHEGIVSLMQMAKTCAAIARLHEAHCPYVSILTDPTTGGVSASFAMMGDINIAEPGALIGFAGRRVIEETIKQKLPDDFQTAEYLLSHGFIDAIVPRKDMKSFVSKFLAYRRS
ncbi:MAG: acetyl-CoA carboxylase, carboxyltransferase subunit beta [Kiritimatiellaeota bacterium]|nr:acetyl-CoA carboxylase, carboxyltransferase subunit beta [Kiritimatiellota bacterium]